MVLPGFDDDNNITYYRQPYTSFTNSGIVQPKSHKTDEVISPTAQNYLDPSGNNRIINYLLPLGIIGIIVLASK